MPGEEKVKEGRCHFQTFQHYPVDKHCSQSPGIAKHKGHHGDTGQCLTVLLFAGVATTCGTEGGKGVKGEHTEDSASSWKDEPPACLDSESAAGLPASRPVAGGRARAGLSLWWIPLVQLPIDTRCTRVASSLSCLRSLSSFCPQAQRTGVALTQAPSSG